MLNEERHIRQVWQSGHYSVYSTHTIPGITPGWMGIIFILTIWAPLSNRSKTSARHQRIESFFERSAMSAHETPDLMIWNAFVVKSCDVCVIGAFPASARNRSVLISAPPTGCPSEKRLVLLSHGSLFVKRQYCVSCLGSCVVYPSLRV